MRCLVEHHLAAMQIVSWWEYKTCISMYDRNINAMCKWLRQCNMVRLSTCICMGDANGSFMRNDTIHKCFSFHVSSSSESTRYSPSTLTSSMFLRGCINILHPLFPSLPLFLFFPFMFRFMIYTWTFSIYARCEWIIDDEWHHPSICVVQFIPSLFLLFTAPWSLSNSISVSFCRALYFASPLNQNRLTHHSSSSPTSSLFVPLFIVLFSLPARLLFILPSCLNLFCVFQRFQHRQPVPPECVCLLRVDHRYHRIIEVDTVIDDQSIEGRCGWGIKKRINKRRRREGTARTKMKDEKLRVGKRIRRWGERGG